MLELFSGNMYPKKICISNECVNAYKNVYVTFKKILEKYIVNDNNFLRYSYQGKDILYYFYRTNENSTEDECKSVVLTNDNKNLIQICLDYINLLNIDSKYHTTFHINYYPKNSFNYMKNPKLNRMPFHKDSSKYTIVHQSENGIFIKNYPRIHNSLNEVIMFKGEMEHKVEMNNKERFSFSTFIFEK